MRVLAIDPGYDRCGVAVLTGTGSQVTLLYSACITTSKTDAFPTRLAAIRKEVECLFDLYKPEILVMEKLHLKANTASAMGVAEARGVVIAQAGKTGIKVYEYSPATVKVAVAGYGRASKIQVTNMVRRLVRCPKRVMLDDEYDAIAVGLTHMASFRRE